MPAGNNLIKIDSYQVVHPAYSDYGLNWIKCFSGESFVGTVNFHPKDKVPKSAVYSSPLLFLLEYEIDRYQDIIETFRYEKPIFIWIYWDENNIVTSAYISTTSEPIGEQEGPGAPPT
jgi:hypothetical protein